MNAIEVYVNMEKGDNEGIVQRILKITSEYMKKNLTEETMSKLMGYANLYYIRRLRKYPTQLLHVLKVLLDVYLSCKDKFSKEVKATVKVKKDSKVLSSLFVIADYLVYYFESCAESVEGMKSPGSIKDEGFNEMNYARHDNVLADYSRTQKVVLEQVLGICLYILVDFDWGMFNELVKDLLKEEAILAKAVANGNTPVPSRGKSDLMQYLIKSIGKYKGTIGSSILESIFRNSETKAALGVTAYKAIMAIVLARPQTIAKEFDLSPPPIHSKDEKVVIKSVSLLEFLLRQATQKLTKDAVTELVNDLSALLEEEPKFLKEVAESPVLINLIFGLSQTIEEAKLAKAQAALLCHIISPSQPHVWKLVVGNSLYKLNVLGEALKISMAGTIERLNIQTALKCIEFTYATEDVVTTDSAVLKSGELLKVVGRLMLLLDKADFIYISVPVWTLCEDRIVKGEEAQQREGGLMRVLFKILTMGIKVDQTRMASVLLRYLVLREKGVKKDIKNFVGGGMKKDGKAKVKMVKYNIIDIVVRKDQDATKQYNAINEFCIKKVIGGESTVLDPRKVVKSASSLSKEKNFFDYVPSLLGYILGSLFQLMHFELFNVQSYADIPQDEADLIKTLNLYQNQELKFTDKYRQLAGFIQDVIKGDRKDEILATLTTEFEKFVDYVKSKLKVDATSDVEIKLGKVYSVLDSKPEPKHEAITEVKLKALADKLDAFKKLWTEFAKCFISGLKSSSKLDNSCAILTNLLLKPETVLTLQPALLFLTTHGFCKLDSFVALKKHIEFSVRPRSESLESIKFSQELIDKVRDKFANICVPKSKIERDELRTDADFLAGSLYRKIAREQRSEVGCWFDKPRERYLQDLFSYVEKQYNKLLERCSLYQELKGKKMLLSNPFKEFVTLRMGRDKLGRAMKMKQLDQIEDNFCINHNFSYLRRFVLKKMLLKNVTLEGKRISPYEFYEKDFRYKLVQNVFKAPPKYEHVVETQMEEISEESKVIINNSEVVSEADSETGLSTHSVGLLSHSDEYIPKKMKTYEAEMVTIRGAIFGRLSINSTCISFHSEERKSGKKYRYGSTVYNQLYNEKVSKKWKLEEVSEVIVKRYNLIRQAFEIYLHNSKSVFFSLFGKKYVSNFLHDLKSVLRKKPGLQIDVIVCPEKSFADKKYREQWLTGAISNFEYLMLLNKYAGRSFNDISQYPVFPWIIQDYQNKAIALSDSTTYRPLERTMAAISTEKRKRADEKLAILASENESQYQFGSHYLPGRIVLGYMLRIEPYASLLVKFEDGHDAAARMFHYMQHAWESCVRDIADNKELTPEFYYLSEMFGNYNLYSFGLKENEQENSVNLKKVMVDQVVLPPWAKTSHSFIQKNALALESKYVSLNLDKWIDLIFGEKQQDYRYYNLYKPFCDEETIDIIKEELTDSQLTEIQEFGINPIRLFRDKHPQKTEKSVKVKRQYSIFDSFEEAGEHLFALLRVNTFAGNQPINFIESYEKKVITVLNTQRVCHTKEGYINVPHEKSITFVKKEVRLFPYKSLYNELTKPCNNCDAQRCFVTLDSGNYILTCRHYDNSCRLTNCYNGETERVVYFHKSIVNSICASKSKDKVFTGSNDGVAAMWDLKKLGFARPAWHSCDHKLGIISMDTCEKLDLLASAGADGTIALRTISGGKFIRLIKPVLTYHNLPFEISHLRLSHRGYVVIIAKCKVHRGGEGDYISVYSINGEEICMKKLGDIINAIVMSENGYEFITGGKLGKLFKYNIVTLEESDMLERLDGNHLGIEKILNELLDTDTAITAMDLTNQDGCQQLLLGTNKGAFYSYKYSPRLIGSKIFGTLQGLI
eukprot:TRINITY_DN657_c0_g1_i1.p1 TRINITY_DN657_c0_g1~~TRINITY_DN657_c0_g1_i1.p1  ORF type:complete len:1837 (-),score=222.25 TRINITY_DN657_c0_g1_i1:2911-8421(-)